ncbi:hypothetical protein [Herminiimonas sp. CN]|uniref:hypothetical protein n=1 Tax=Herminiimonas sp. CN TaxID=1349818 RepID=UPI000473E5EB|nr:hypothetical protein [Herminiimonas sp. CN]
MARHSPVKRRRPVSFIAAPRAGTSGPLLSRLSSAHTNGAKVIIRRHHSQDEIYGHQLEPSMRLSIGDAAA